jgi:hypothetical protein
VIDDDSASGDGPATAEMVDLLKRHTALPSRQLVLSEAFELGRRLQSETAGQVPRAPADDSGSDS